MQDLHAWLNSAIKNYENGVQLYLKYGKKAKLKTLFSQEEQTDFKTGKLLEELKKLAAVGPGESLSPTVTSRKSIVAQKQPEPGKEIPLSGRAWSDDQVVDDIERSLHDQFKPKYAEAMSLQQRIYEVAQQGEAGDSNKALEAAQMAHRIIDLDDELEGIYSQRDHYRANGRLPAAAAQKEIIGDPVRWATELQNLKRYAREYRGKLTKHPKHKNASKWTQKLADINADIARYKKLLKLDDETD